MKLSVAWFNVNDFEQAKKFYGSVLGLKKSFEMDGWAEFNGGGQDEAAVGILTGQYTPKEHGARRSSFALTISNASASASNRVA